MAMPRELTREECARLLRAGVVGRVAFTAPDGPHVVPVNYSVVDDTVVVATSPYSDLATHASGSVVAFEVDHLDHEQHTGWSVVVRGRADPVLDPEELRQLRQVWPPRPWADGTRNLHLRLPWTELSGRSLGGDTEVPVRRVVGS